MRIFFCTAVLFFAVTCSSQQTTCYTTERGGISNGIKQLFDSLLAQERSGHKYFTFVSDSITVTDTAEVQLLPIDAGRNVGYFPRYLQFHGDYASFLAYLLYIDPALDSIVTCNRKVMLYYSDRCDFCDSGFWSGTMYMPTQFHYYRFQEIYGAFFQCNEVNEVQVFVGGKNRTYLPYASDFPVFAPGKSMKKKWFVRNKDYGLYFPVDFPAASNSDFIIDGDDFIWTAGAADRHTRK